MNGWIIRNRISGQGSDSGDLLSSDGLIYSFRFSDQPAFAADLELKTPVSFSLLPADAAGQRTAVIEGTVAEPSEPETERFREQMEASLSPKRYLHTFRVSKIARALAERFGCSPQKAEIAGLLHDTAKENPAEENIRIVRQAGLRMASFELENHSILHAAAGAALASSRYGVEDPEILNAIRYHNGRPAMSKMEKIIFLADHIDYVYKNGMGPCNEITSEQDLDRAAYRMFTIINRKLVLDGMQTDAITESTMNYMFVNLTGAMSSSDSASDSDTFLSDELFDRALEITAQRGLRLRSVKNIRELGGCAAFDGRHVRRGMLIRSAQLSSMTAEDAARLADFGIRTVIDLRSADEIADEPDRNAERFCRIHCPLASAELTQYQKNIMEKYSLTSPGEEKAYYLSEYLSCISMKEQYMNVLTEESSVRSLRQVFEILCRPDSGGILLHCTGGKDRTGIVAALILLALGTPAQEIREDYYTSALATFSETEAFAQSLRKQHYSADFIDEMRYYNGIGMKIAEEAAEAVASRYGSVENYLKQELLSDEQLRILREKYTQ